MPIYKKYKIPHSFLKELIYYNPKTGLVYWKIRNRDHFNEAGNKINQTDRFNKLFAKKIVGSITSLGYYQVAIQGVQYRLHRVIWFYMTKEWPADEVDHKDRNPLNNKWDNLREGDRSLQTRNREYKRNTSGIIGVNWKKPQVYGEL